MTVSSSDQNARFPLGLVELVVFSFGALLLVVGFEHPLSIVTGYYWQKEEYSHAFLLPPIAALISWHRLIEKHVDPKPSWAGLLVLIMGLLLLVVGELSTFDVIALYGFIIALMGLCATMFGFPILYVMLPGFICLFFAVPLPQLLFVTLSAQLQLISSSLGVMVLDALGVPVYQEGNVIDLGGIQLQVADACSGLRYLFPLMSFAFLIAYLYRAAPWKRLVIFVSSVPLTIGMNSLRIALIGVTVDKWGIAMAQGVLHEMEGWTIFLICALILMLEVHILRRIGRAGEFRWHYLSLPPRIPFSRHSSISPSGIVAVILATIMGLVANGEALSKRTVTIPPHASLATFPIVIGAWEGRLAPFEKGILTSLKLTDYWSADYVSEKETSSVNLYVAYYQRQDLNSAIHSPSNCVPAGGWQVIDSDTYSLNIAGNQSPLRVTRMLVNRSGSQALIYYWFDERGRDITNQYWAKWYLLIDAIVMNRTDGSLIRLVTPVGQNENPAAADARLSRFLNGVMPTLRNYL